MKLLIKPVASFLSLSLIMTTPGLGCYEAAASGFKAARVAPLSGTLVRSQLANYKRFKALTTQWVDLALALAEEKLRADKERRKSEALALKQKTGRD